MIKPIKCTIVTFAITVLFAAVLWVICMADHRYAYALLTALAIPTALWLIRLLYKWLAEN